MKTETKSILGMLSAAFLVLALSGCLGELPTSDTTFIIEDLTNPCIEELVDISGTYHVTQDENQYYLQFHGTGEGDQGNKYVYNSGYYGSAEEAEMTVEVISKGKAPNFLIKIQAHPDESGSVIIDRAEAVCTNPRVVIPMPIPTSPP